MQDNQVDIAFITETWLSNESSVTTFAIKEAGYEIEHAYRSKRGGGVGILWKSSLNVKCNSKIKVYQSLQFKNIVIAGDIQINCICIYRLQEIPVSQFMEDLKDLLSFYCTLYDTIVLTRGNN